MQTGCYVSFWKKTAFVVLGISKNFLEESCKQSADAKYVKWNLNHILGKYASARTIWIYNCSLIPSLIINLPKMVVRNSDQINGGDKMKICISWKVHPSTRYQNETLPTINRALKRLKSNNTCGFGRGKPAINQTSNSENWMEISKFGIPKFPKLKIWKSKNWTPFLDSFAPSNKILKAFDFCLLPQEISHKSIKDFY